MTVVPRLKNDFIKPIEFDLCGYEAIENRFGSPSKKPLELKVICPNERVALDILEYLDRLIEADCFDIESVSGNDDADEDDPDIGRNDDRMDFGVGPSYDDEDDLILPFGDEYEKHSFVETSDMDIEGAVVPLEYFDSEGKFDISRTFEEFKRKHDLNEIQENIRKMCKKK